MTGVWSKVCDNTPNPGIAQSLILCPLKSHIKVIDRFDGANGKKPMFVLLHLRLCPQRKDTLCFLY